MEVFGCLEILQDPGALKASFPNPMRERKRENLISPLKDLSKEEVLLGVNQFKST